MEKNKLSFQLKAEDFLPAGDDEKKSLVVMRESVSFWKDGLRRFKRKCARAGVLAEIRKREHYEKPSVKRKKKAEAARKRKH